MAKTKISASYDDFYALPVRIDIDGSFHLLTVKEAKQLIEMIKNVLPKED